MSADLPPDVRDRAAIAAKVALEATLDQPEYEREAWGNAVDAVAEVLAAEQPDLMAEVCQLERENFDLARTIRIWAKATEREADPVMNRTFLALDGAATELRRLRNEVPREYIPYANELDIEITHAENALQGHVAERDALKARVAELERQADVSERFANNMYVEAAQATDDRDALKARVDLLTTALTELITLHERDVVFDGVAEMSASWANARAVLSAGEGTS